MLHLTRRLQASLLLVWAASSLAVLAGPVQRDSTPSLKREVKLLLTSASKSDSTVAGDADAVLAMGLQQAASLSQAAYCSSVMERQWQCGRACQAVADLQVLWTDGDNRKIPYMFVGSSATLRAIVVAQAGSNFDSIHAFLSDGHFALRSADSELDDGSRGDTARVHSGFLKLWRRSREDISKQVKKALTATGMQRVIFTGHSLGGALSQLDAVNLRNKLPPQIIVEHIGFGTPRVGSQEWANLVDKVLGNSHVQVVNFRDPVPHLPTSKIGYRHPRNEVWIDQDSEKTVLCRGQENEECADSIGKLRRKADDHKGPYFGVEMNSVLCDRP